MVRPPHSSDEANQDPGDCPGENRWGDRSQTALYEIVWSFAPSAYQKFKQVAARRIPATAGERAEMIREQADTLLSEWCDVITDAWNKRTIHPDPHHGYELYLWKIVQIVLKHRHSILGSQRSQRTVDLPPDLELTAPTVEDLVESGNRVLHVRRFRLVQQVLQPLSISSIKLALIATQFNEHLTNQFVDVENQARILRQDGRDLITNTVLTLLAVRALDAKDWSLLVNQAHSAVQIGKPELHEELLAQLRFRSWAVARADAQGRSATEITKELGISLNQLYLIRRTYRKKLVNWVGRKEP